MRPIKVLIVDDAVVVRKMLTDILSSDPGIEVLGTAPNGRIALQKLEQLKPDLVTMDIEMPDMDGLQTLPPLRAKYPNLPVIMFSTLTERGAAATMEALALGANEYVTKPANVGSVTVAIQRIREELVPKIKALCPQIAPPAPRVHSPLVAGRTRPRAASAPASSQRVDIVAIGVSTGGPNALTALMGALEPHFPVPMVIVQHMPPIFTRHLAERLDSRSPLHVHEGDHGDPVTAGHAWVAPGGKHMEIKRVGTAVRLVLHAGPMENSCRPAVDPLFRSVAKVYGGNTLAVVLTGMGQDGLRGAEDISAAGGQVWVQDRASSVVWGMPGAVADAGLADRVLPLDQLAFEINRRVRVGRPAPTVAARST